MDFRAVAIHAFAQNHSPEEVENLIGMLLDKGAPRDDHGHYYKEAGAPCPHKTPHNSEKHLQNRLQLYPKRSKISREPYERKFRVSGNSKGFNADVFDPETGGSFRFVKGSKVENIKTFAGYGGTKELEPSTLDGLCSEYGGDPKKWAHRKGIGVLDRDGEEVKAEVHWFQEETVGKVKFKLKKWYEDS